MPDPDVFFPGAGDSKTKNEAKRVCAKCPVRFQCKAEAEERQERYGIWGGEIKTQYRKKG